MTIRIGSSPDTEAESIQRREQRVVRLSALVHFELEVRVLAARASATSVRDVGLVRAGEQRDDPARLGEQPLEDRARDLVEVGALRDRLAVGEAEEVALCDRERRSAARPSTRRSRRPSRRTRPLPPCRRHSLRHLRDCRTQRSRRGPRESNRCG